MTGLEKKQAGTAATVPDLMGVKNAYLTTPHIPSAENHQTIPVLTALHLGEPCPMKRKGGGTVPAPSLRGAIDAKCRDCGAGDAGANWRVHTTCCPVTDCPLWRVRPLSKHLPEWLASRTVDALPIGWRSLPMADAMTMIRTAPENALQDSVTLPCGVKPGAGGAIPPIQHGNATGGRGGVMEGGASW